MSDTLPGPAAAPCKRCPYRRDTRPGLWHVSEYEKLLKYDGDMDEQASKGATQPYMCTKGLGNLCAGWLSCHGSDNLLALRLNDVHPRVWDFETMVPVWSSGAEAYAHGTRREVD